MLKNNRQQASIIFIFITLVIDILGLGIIIPILPELITEFAGGDKSNAGLYLGVFTAIYALMQFVFAPILGALSDKYGRRPVILLSLLGLGIDYIILALAPDLWWLLVGRIIAGIMGASFTTANAYIADISTPENRAQNFGLVGVAFGLGFTFGPVIGGFLGNIDLRLPFWVSAVLVFLNLIYGYFVLPESLKPENRSNFKWSKVNPISIIGELRNYPFVGNIAGALFFIYFAERGLQNVWVLYTGYRYGWDIQTIGLTLGLVGIMAIIVQGFLIRMIIPRLGERRSILLGLGLSILTYLGYGFATEGWMVYVIIIVGALSGIAGPALQGLITGSVPANAQGKVQGALTSLNSITSILSPIIFTSILFSFFTSDRVAVDLPGIPFILGAVSFIFSLWLMQRVFKTMPIDMSKRANQN